MYIQEHIKINLQVDIFDLKITYSNTEVMKISRSIIHIYTYSNI